MRVCESSSGASRLDQFADHFSAPNADMISGIQIKRLPAGAALGADDLQTWSQRRSVGRSGAPATKEQWKQLQQWKSERKEHTDMSTDKKYPNSGALFRNSDKADPKHADYGGSISIEGVGEFWINGWLKDGAKGKFLSLSIKPKQQKTAVAAAGGAGRCAKADMDDEIPFAPEWR